MTTNTPGSVRTLGTCERRTARASFVSKTGSTPIGRPVVGPHRSPPSRPLARRGRGRSAPGWRVPRTLLRQRMGRHRSRGSVRAPAAAAVLTKSPDAAGRRHRGDADRRRRPDHPGHRGPRHAPGADRRLRRRRPGPRRRSRRLPRRRRTLRRAGSVARTPAPLSTSGRGYHLARLHIWRSSWLLAHRCVSASSAAATSPGRTRGTSGWRRTSCWPPPRSIRPRARRGARRAAWGWAFTTLDELLAADDVDLVVNLTFQAEHARVSRAALEAGKHVHSEKPLALSADEAWGLVALARTAVCGWAVRRSRCSARRSRPRGSDPRRTGGRGQGGVLRGRLGPHRELAPGAAPFYEVGPVSDVGIYPMSIATAMFGPVRRVQAFGRVLAPDRVTKDGTPYASPPRTCRSSSWSFEPGVVVRLTASFYAGRPAHDPASIVFHGDTGSVWLETFMRLDCGVAAGTLGDEDYDSLPLCGPRGGHGLGAGAVRSRRRIADERPHRATGEQAAHLVDVIDAARASMSADGRAVEVTSSFPPPAPMPWAT